MKLSTIWIVAFALGAQGAFATAVDVDLGTASQFAVLAGSTVTNTGPTSVTGELGVWAGTAVTGFPPGVVTGGTIHSMDAVAMQAQSDLTTAFNAAAGQACDSDLTGQDLGGMTLTPGVYCFDSTAGLTGTLTLNSQGDDSAVFLFQIGSALTTASASSVTFTNGDVNRHVYWQIGSSATLGTTTAFAGNILALTSITLTTGATIECGRALASNGAVTMDSNEVSFDTPGCQDASEVPEPSSAVLLLLPALYGLRRLYRTHSADRVRT